MTVRLLFAGLTAAICLTCLSSARAQQMSPSRWMTTQPVAPSQSSPFVDKDRRVNDRLVAESDEGYERYETVEASEIVQASPMSGIKRFYHKFFLEAKRNNAWPHPYLYADRAAIRAPFVVMVNNGWRRQNTLGKYHFRENGSALTEAGEIKIRWILLEGPVHHRTIYVHNAPTAEETAKRIDAVQHLAIKLMPTGALPAVLQTNIGPPGWPAGQIDDINRKFQSSAPAPRLQESSSESGDINQ